MADSVVAHYTDPYAFQTAIRGAELEFLPTKNGDFHAELTKVTLHKLWMQRGKEISAANFSWHGVATTGGNWFPDRLEPIGISALRHGRVTG